MQKRTKTYLVTGGTGFIGSALVKALVKSGNKVRVLDNNWRGNAKRLVKVIDEVELIEGDVRDYACVERSLKGVDSVCHLASVNGTRFFYEQPEMVLEVAVKGMVNVLDGCIKHNVRELILASSSEVYQEASKIPTDENIPLVVPDVINPRYSYGGSKIISELLVINYGRKYFDRVLIFRPHNVYGPDMGCEHVIPQFIVRMKEIIKNDKNKKIRFPIQGTGKETRSFVFIDDFIKGLILVIEKGEHLGIYNIGTTAEVTIKQLAIEIGKYFGRQVVVCGGKSAAGGAPRRCPDITKIKKLGYIPKVSLDEGLKITAEWYGKNL